MLVVGAGPAAFCAEATELLRHTGAVCERVAPGNSIDVVVRGTATACEAAASACEAGGPSTTREKIEHSTTTRNSNCVRPVTSIETERRGRGRLSSSDDESGTEADDDAVDCRCCAGVSGVWDVRVW